MLLPLLPPPPTQVRLDAGDGLASHPYVPYYYTISRDGGVTWPKVSSDPAAAATDEACLNVETFRSGQKLRLLV